MLSCMRCGIESKITYTLSLVILNQESGNQVNDTKVFCKKCSDLIYKFCTVKNFINKNDDIELRISMGFQIHNEAVNFF